MRVSKGLVCLLCGLGVLSLGGYSLRDLVPSMAAQGATEAPAAPKAAELPEHVVAKIGDQVVYASEVLGRVQEVESGRPAEQQLVGPAYEYAINQRLLELEAKRLEIGASDADKKREVEDYIERRKKALTTEYGGQMSWKNYLQSVNLTEEKLREVIYSKAELMVLRRRLVNYWEQTTDSAQIIEITISNEDPAAAKKRADEVLARIDSEVIANRGVANPKTTRDIFASAAILASAHNSTPVRMVFAEEPMDESVRNAIFSELKPMNYTEVLKVNDHDFRIIFLDTMYRRNVVPFKDLQEAIDKLDPVDNDDRYRRWINAVYRGGRYQVQFRFPGRETITTAQKPSEPAKD